MRMASPPRLLIRRGKVSLQNAAYVCAAVISCGYDDLYSFAVMITSCCCHMFHHAGLFCAFITSCIICPLIYL